MNHVGHFMLLMCVPFVLSLLFVCCVKLLDWWDARGHDGEA